MKKMKLGLISLMIVQMAGMALGQEPATAAASQINSGDTSWILMGAALVMRNILPDTKGSNARKNYSCKKISIQ